MTLRIRKHVLRIHFDGIVAQLRLGHRLQTVRTSRKVRVTLHPRKSVEVKGKVTAALARGFALETNFSVHVHTVLLGARLHEWEIEVVTVVRHVNARLNFAHVVEPLANERFFGRFVPDDERARVISLGRVLKVFHVLAHNLAVDNQVTLAVNHVRNHKHLIVFGIRKLERKLGRLNVKGTDAHFAAIQHFRELGQRHRSVLRPHRVPLTATRVGINHKSHVIRHIVLSNINHCILVICQRLFRLNPGVQTLLMRERLVRRRRGARFLFIPRNNRHHLSPHLHELLHRRKRHLQIGLLQPAQVILQIQILLIHHLHIHQLFRVLSPKQRFDFVFAPRLGCQVKIRRIPHLRLERRSILRHEETIHRRVRLSTLRILNLRAARVDQPTHAIRSARVRRETQLFLQRILLRRDLRLGSRVIRRRQPASSTTASTTTASTTTASTASTASRFTVHVRLVSTRRARKRRFLPGAIFTSRRCHRVRFPRRRRTRRTTRNETTPGVTDERTRARVCVCRRVFKSLKIAAVDF